MSRYDIDENQMQNQMQKKKKKKNKKGGKKWIALGVVAAVVVGGAYYSRTHKATGTDSSQNAMMIAKTSLATATRGSIDLTTEGEGQIGPKNEKSYLADFSLTIDHVEAENGDRVEAGDVIATVDRDSIDTQIETIRSQITEADNTIKNMDDDGSDSLTSPISGRVKRVFTKEGDLLMSVMTDKGGLMEINADGRLQVEFTTETEIAEGTKVKVNFLNFEEEGIVEDVKSGRGMKTVIVTFADSVDYPVDTEAQVKDVNGALLGTGTLQSHRPYLVEGNYGVVSEMRVSANDWVDAGSTLLTRNQTSYNREYLDVLDKRANLMEDLQTLRSMKENAVLTAPAAGVISDVALKDGTPLQEGGMMYNLIGTDSYELKAEIDELSIAGVQVGQRAKVVFDALEDQEFEGTVSKISALGNNTNGVTTYTVTIDVAGDERLKTSMSATATITTEHADDAILIPVDAVQTRDGSKYVTVIDGENQREVQVTLGLVNNTTAQVVEGLGEGDQVVVIGTSEMEDMVNLMRAGRESSRSNDSNNAGGENE